LKYYKEAINKTSKKNAPWYIIPAVDKEMSRYIIAKIIWVAIQQLTDIKAPELDPKIKANIAIYKK
jgi:polyphosphate kinase 2 (PPK2 family)